jgi:hypothetical protein
MNEEDAEPLGSLYTSCENCKRRSHMCKGMLFTHKRSTVCGFVGSLNVPYWFEHAGGAKIGAVV